VGLIEHQIYVTLDKPFAGQLDPEAKPENPYEDIFCHICKYAEGLDNESIIVNTTWNGAFKGRKLSRFELARGKDDVDATGMVY